MLSEIRSLAWPPCPAPFNLAAHVLARADDQPDKIAVQLLRPSGAEGWSYAHLARAVRGIAGGLGGLGLTPGARVLLRIDNSLDFPLAFLGAVAADLLPVAAPAGLTVPEVTRLCQTLTPELVIAAPGISLPEAPRCPILTTAELRTLAGGPEGGFVMGDPERPAYLVCTSGTSGAPRAVVHAHRAIWARQMMRDGWDALRESDRILHAGAMNWTFTLGTGLLDPWATGATALVPVAGTLPAQLPLYLKSFDVTLFAAAPGIYRQMLKAHPTLNLPRLRHGLTAGEALSDPLRAAWGAATGKPLYEAFGLSECSTFLSASPKSGETTMRAQPGRTVALIGPDGAAVPIGTPGVIGIHRSDPGLFLTYFGAEAEAEDKFAGDWFLTGDMAMMAADGSIRTLGRTDDMMNAGGFRVAPQEVEAALSTCEGAGDVAACELSLGPGRSIIGVFYTGPAAPEDLALHAEAALARYKCPRHYEWLTQLPLTATGKINRRHLREKWTPKT